MNSYVSVTVDVTFKLFFLGKNDKTQREHMHIN